MLIHIGAGTLVREGDILGYFDLDGKVDSAITKDFLQRAEKCKRCVSAGCDLPRSFVLCAKQRRSCLSKPRNGSDGEAGEKVIFTHISTQALKKR